jgi:hypothetical protein
MLAADNFTSARALQAIAAAASKAAGDDSVISSSEQLKEDLERQSKATTGITNSRVRRIGALETELLGKFRTVELLKLTG